MEQQEKKLCRRCKKNERKYSNGMCLECNREYYREYGRKNREKKTASHRKWQKKNKEKVNEYMAGFRDKNRDEYNEYHRKYYDENKDLCKESQKKYVDSLKGYWLYNIVDEDDKSLYVGASTRIAIRYGEHIRGEVSATKDFMQTKEWKYYNILDLSDFVENVDELFTLENILIQHYKPKSNTYTTYNGKVSDERKEFLIEKMKDVKFKIYKQNPLRINYAKECV